MNYQHHEFASNPSSSAEDAQISTEGFSRRSLLKALGITGLALLSWGRKVTGKPAEAAANQVASKEKPPGKESQLPPVKYLLNQTPNLPLYASPNLEAEFIPRYPILAGAVICGELLAGNEQFVKIHPDNGVDNPFWRVDGQSEVFVRLEHFREITNFEPISIKPNTQNWQKQIIVHYNGYYPEAILLENQTIVAYFPVGLGGTHSASNTFPGDYHISSLRLARNMNTLPGVPFVAYYQRGAGKAFHGAPWKDWSTIKQGYFGSAGCINVPSYQSDSLYNVQWEGQRLGFDHFLFLWLRTVFNFDPYQIEEMEVEWDPHDWYSGDHTVRTLVVEKIDDLYEHPTHPQRRLNFTSWQLVIDRYQQLQAAGQWLIPTK